MKPTEIKCNLHTHTLFCDGKNSPEEIVLAALEAGMETIGFSGHSYTPFDLSYAMSPEGTQAYLAELSRLKAAYGDQICILAGIEQDFYAPPAKGEYDFRIGSVHYVLLDGAYCAVDSSPELLERAVIEHCGGDWYRFARVYYDTVAQLMEVVSPDVVGHFDLITKFNERFPKFEEHHPRYLRAALESLDCLLERDAVIEINTGAINRGYRRLPYPAPILLRRIAEKRGRVTLSSDAHAKEQLTGGFIDASRILLASGISTVEVRDRHGWRTVRL